MKIIIETIEHKDQRYDTCGDWYWDDDLEELTIKVSMLPHYFEYEAVLLIGVHELIEALLCRRSVISDREVDESDRRHGALATPEHKEPGDDPKAPYHHQHVFASNIERLIAQRLHINWQQYEQEIERLA